MIENIYDEVTLAHEFLIAFSEGECPFSTAIIVDTAGNHEFESVVETKGSHKPPPPLSLRLIDHESKQNSLCPGFASMGDKWRSYHINRSHHNVFRVSMGCLSRAQPVAVFRKECFKGHIPRPITAISLALDDPIAAPKYQTFDEVQITPDHYKDVPSDCNIPSTIPQPYSLLKCQLESEIDGRMPSPITALDEAAKKGINALNQSHDERRYNGNNFCWADKLSYNTQITPRIFGITEEAASPNKTSVNRRDMWHSKDVCVELLSEKRGSEDFHHLLEHEFTNRTGGYQGDPTLLTLHLRAYEAHTVKSVGLQRHLAMIKESNAAESSERHKKIVNNGLLLLRK